MPRSIESLQEFSRLWKNLWTNGKHQGEKVRAKREREGFPLGVFLRRQFAPSGKRPAGMGDAGAGGVARGGAAGGGAPAKKMPEF